MNDKELRRFFLPEEAVALLRDIQTSPEPFELWTYATVELQHIYAFAIRQGKNWYSIEQDGTGIGHDEYLLFRIQRHRCGASAPSDVPQLLRKQAGPFRCKRLIQPGPPPIWDAQLYAVYWQKLNDFLPPHNIFVYRDCLLTRIERMHGEDRAMEESADIALAFETPSFTAILQLMAAPYFLPLLRHSEDDITSCKEFWYLHYDSDEEIEELKRIGGAEAEQVCRKVGFTRTKLRLAEL